MLRPAQHGQALEVGNETGKINVRMSRWFSLEVNEEKWPWIFEKRSEPLIISPLEALAVVVALKVYYGDVPGSGRSRFRVVPTTTDNRGNGAALKKLMTTKYPASAVLMEIAACSRKMGLRASVEWSPREANGEADALANGDHSQFSPELLTQALVHGQEAEEARRAAYQNRSDHDRQ